MDTNDTNKSVVSPSDNRYTSNNSAYTSNSYGNYTYNQNSNNQSYSNGYDRYQSYYQQKTEPETKPAQESKPAKKIKKEHGAGYKIAIASIVGLMFGVFAALGFWGVNKLTDTDNKKVAKNEKVQESVEQSEDSVKGIENGKTDAEDNLKPSAEEAKANDSDDEIPEIANTEEIADDDFITGGYYVMDVTDVVKSAMPSVVSVNSTAVQQYRDTWGRVYAVPAGAAGSGIIIGQNDSELLIATNNHVVSGAEELTVTFCDDETIAAQIKGTYEERDLAIIAVLLTDIPNNVMSDIAIARLGSSDDLQVGEPVVAIGNALGYGQSVTTGIVSALNRPIGTSEEANQSMDEVAVFIQTDAAINPGNSGGALLNMKGELIGINSNKIGGSTVEGMGYAIPISDAQPILEELMNYQTKLKVSESERGRLSLSGINVERDYSELYGLPVGVYVSEVEAGGAAEKAGIIKGDVIVSLDDQDIDTMEQLKKELEYHSKGESVKVVVMRAFGNEYQPVEIMVVLDSKQ